MKLAKIIFLSAFMFFWYSRTYADTLYLKNGRVIEGIIKNENDTELELEVLGGVVKFNKSEIGRIDKASPQQFDALRQQWEKQTIENQKRISQQQLEDLINPKEDNSEEIDRRWRQYEAERQEAITRQRLQEQEKEERKPREVELSRERQGMVIEATLNGQVKASLILDTGSSLIVLTRAIARELGINVGRLKPDIKMQLADGWETDAKFIILKSVEVEGVEAKNVEAAILLDETGDADFGDGFLGMSFLKRFNFTVDHKENKLILEKI